MSGLLSLARTLETTVKCVLCQDFCVRVRFHNTNLHGVTNSTFRNTSLYAVTNSMFRNTNLHDVSNSTFRNTNLHAVTNSTFCNTNLHDMINSIIEIPSRNAAAGAAGITAHCMYGSMHRCGGNTCALCFGWTGNLLLVLWTNRSHSLLKYCHWFFFLCVIFILLVLLSCKAFWVSRIAVYIPFKKKKLLSSDIETI